MIQTSTSTYYYKSKIDRAKRDKADADLRDKMEEVQTIFPRCGYRTMKEYLARDFELVINHKKIRRIMGKYELIEEFSTQATTT